LPFAFASHFAPDFLHTALRIYRENFRPSDQLDRPHAMVGVNVFAADTDAEAQRLFTSLQQQFVNLVRGAPDKTPPPVDTMDGVWSPAERVHVERMTRYAVVGGPGAIRRGLDVILEDTQADEIIATGSMFEHAARLRSFEIAAHVFKQINAHLATSAAAPEPASR
jgi:luciferase family oxidoreductase group 1